MRKVTQGPANTCSASSKLRPCLARFFRFFASSQSYFIPSHGSIVVLFVVTHNRASPFLKKSLVEARNVGLVNIGILDIRTIAAGQTPTGQPPGRRRYGTVPSAPPAALKPRPAADAARGGQGEA